MHRNPRTRRPRTRCSSREARREKRLLCSDLLQLRWTEPAGGRREEIAVVEEVSPSGTTLFLGVPVPAGSDVMLCTGAESRPGVVRHSSPRPNGHTLGVQLHGHWRLHREGSGFAAEHLLDVARLDLSAED